MFTLRSCYHQPYYKHPNFEFDKYTLFLLPLILRKFWEWSVSLIVVLCGRRGRIKWLFFPHLIYLIINGLPLLYFCSTFSQQKWNWTWKDTPPVHISEVTKYHANLNYAIQVRYTIDVGKIIHSSLTYIIRGTTSMGLGNAYLIYALCVNAGVSGNHSEELFLYILSLIKGRMKSFERLCVEEGVCNEPRRLSSMPNSSNSGSF